MAPVMWQLSEARNRTAETTSDGRLFGWSEGLCPLAAASPPSIRKSAPFTKLLSSQARNRAAAATGRCAGRQERDRAGGGRHVSLHPFVPQIQLLRRASKEEEPVVGKGR